MEDISKISIDYSSSDKSEQISLPDGPDKPALSKSSSSTSSSTSEWSDTEVKREKKLESLESTEPCESCESYEHSSSDSLDSWRRSYAIPTIVRPNPMNVGKSCDKNRVAKYVCGISTFIVIIVTLVLLAKYGKRDDE